MVKRLDIENFKSIRKQTVELSNLNILIGQNGAGKSNFIKLFKFLERLVSQQLSDYIFQGGGINDFLYNGYTSSNYIKLNVELGPPGNDSNLYSVGINSNGQDHLISSEEYGYWKKLQYSKPIKYDVVGGDRKEAYIKPYASNRSVGQYVVKYLTELKVYHFHDTSDNAKVKLPQEIDDVYFFKNEAKDFNTYSRIIDSIRLIYPKFSDFELKESPTAKGKIILRWTEKGNEHIFNVKQISDGTLRFMCLATLLLQPKGSDKVPGTILLDEPELGLHPFAIHILAELIKKSSLDRQIIMATQSVTLINHFEPADLLITERDDEGATIFNRKTNEELEEWLQEFTLGEIWETNLIGGRP
jgi:predicted ATPase